MIELGTVTSEEALVSETTSPAVGAGPVIVTVPVELNPPRTEVGFIEIEVTSGARTVTLAVRDRPCDDAVMVETRVTGTATVNTVKPPD